MDSHTNPRMIQFHLKVSKCDQFGAGSNIVVGRVDSPLCPVTAILKYIEIWGDRPGPFFIDSSHTAITKQKFTKRIRDILNSLGLQHDHYAGHSFRIGAATTAAVAGVEDSTIQTLGRWHSAAFLQYIRTPQRTPRSAIYSFSKGRRILNIPPITDFLGISLFSRMFAIYLHTVRYAVAI